MNQAKLVGSILTLLLFFSSCNILFDMKDASVFVECTKPNCYDLKVEGLVINKATNDSLNNIPITLNWVNPAYTLSSGATINVQYSNNSGSFSFINSIDTSLFSNGYHLNISIPNKSDYIVFPKGNSFSVYDPTDPILKSIKYELYPKAQLQIQLIREKTDALESLVVTHSFRKDSGYADRTILKTNGIFDNPLNDQLSVETSADVKTYISWTKKVSGVKTLKTDSIVCKQNAANIYKIRY